MLEPFEIAAQPNWNAIVQQAALCGAIHRNARALALDAIGFMGGGQLLAWKYEPNRPVPSYMIWKQGKTFNIALAGAAHIWQVADTALNALAPAIYLPAPIFNPY